MTDTEFQWAGMNVHLRPHTANGTGAHMHDDRLPPDTIVFAQDPTTLRIDGPDA